MCNRSMRAIGNRVIAFGLVNVPVKIYSATEDHDIRLHQVHDKDGGRIHYERRCDVCGKVIPFEHIDKAYEGEEKTVILTEDDFKSLPVEHSNEIAVVEFVPSDQVDPIMFDRSYFLQPDKSSAKAYVLLRRTLEETDRTAIVHFDLRQKTRLGALRVHDDVLMLQSLLWDDEVRDADFPELRGDIRVAAQELEMASKLVSSYESDFTPDKFTDDYQVQLRQLIDAKLKQGDAIDTEATFGEVPEKEGAEVVDLMEALRRSVEKNRGGSGKRRTASPSKSAAASAGKSAGTSSRKSTAKPARAAGSGKSSGETAKTKKKAG